MAGCEGKSVQLWGSVRGWEGCMVRRCVPCIVEQHLVLLLDVT